jgi:hypothetical protein
MAVLVPRQITWEVVGKSSNQAALPLLAAGLASPSVEVRMQCLESLLSRPEILARKHILLQWSNLTETEVEYVRRNTLHFQCAALDILENGSLAEQRLVLTAISQLQLPGCLSDILKIVIDPLHALQSLASECLLAICIDWGRKARADKDVPSVRGPMLETVYKSLLEYPKHKSHHVVDAWLALVHWDDSLQRGLVGDPGHVAFNAIIARLNATPDNQTQYKQLLKLMAGYLVRATAPKSIHRLVCEKADPQLALELAAIVGTANWEPLKRRLRELPALACLQTLEGGFQECSLAEKKRLWLLMSVSSIEYGQVLRGALQIAKTGNTEGRQVAAEIVKNCRKPELDEMVGELQCALAGIAKPNSAGPAMLEIVLWVKSPSVPLKQAAKELFNQFTVEGLIEQVSHWPTSMCKAMAYVVSLTNDEFTSRLIKELECPSPKKRLAALRATQMLGHSETVSQNLLPMLDDPRLEVRVRVIDLLSELGGVVLDQMLPSWLNDVNTDIQEAAKRVMRRRERQKKAQPTEQLSRTDG